MAMLNKLKLNLLCFICLLVIFSFKNQSDSYLLKNNCIEDYNNKTMQTDSISNTENTGNLYISSRMENLKINITTENHQFFYSDSILPLNLNLFSGIYIIEVTKDYRYDTLSFAVYVNPGETTHIENLILLPEFYTININTKHPGAEIFLSSKKIGTGNIKSYKVKAGEYELDVRNNEELYGFAKYKPFKKKILINKNINTDIQLQPDFGTLELDQKLNNAIIKINKKDARLNQSVNKFPV